MPYGIASPETLSVLGQGHMLKALDLPDSEDRNLLHVDVVIDGALDESFEVLELWAVNVVDLIADYLRESYNGIEWQVVAYEPEVSTHYERNNYGGEE